MSRKEWLECQREKFTAEQLAEMWVSVKCKSRFFEGSLYLIMPLSDVSEIQD